MVAAFAAALIAAPFIGRSFLPTMDEGDIIIQLQKLPSISLEEALRVDMALERRILAEVPEVRAVIARSGSDELGLDPMGPNETDVFLQLEPRDQWRGDKQRIIQDLRRIGSALPGVDVSFTQPIEMRVSEMLTGTRGDLAVKIFGPDLAQLNLLAQKIRHTLQSIPGSEDVLYAANDGVQYLGVDLDRTVAGRLGMSAADIQRQLRMLVEATLDFPEEEIDPLRDTDLCSGPARLCQAMSIDRALNGVDLIGGDSLFIERGDPVDDAGVGVGVRIGIGSAGEWTRAPLRWALKGNPHVSVPIR